MSFIESLIAAKAAAGIAGAGSGGGYTDQVPVSTDADGSVFNGTGYQNDSYISSSTGGVSSQAGYVVTGFIPYAEGDVIRFKGAIWGEGSYSRIAFYDADKNKILVGTYPSSGEVADEGNGVYRLTPTVAEGGGKAYVRLSFYGTGENLVVTINEKIVSVVADWNTMLNKPFYEEVTETTGPLNLSWDGNIDGRECHVVMAEDGGNMVLCKISDVVLTMEDLSAGTMALSSPEGNEGLSLGSDVSPSDLQESFGIVGVGIVLDGIPYMVSLPEDGTFGTANFTAGTYFFGAVLPGATTAMMYTSNLSNPDAVVTMTDEVIHKIDNKYLDLSWIPKGEIATIKWDGDSTGKESYDDGVVVKVSDAIFTAEQLVGATLTVSGSGKEASYTLTQDMIEDFAPSLEEIRIKINDFIFAQVYYGTNNYHNASTGVYFLGLGGAYVSSLTIPSVLMEGEKLPEAFLPDTVATKADLEAARSYVILNSSTKGSTKQFKVTVDDSGTLTATEVT